MATATYGQSWRTNGRQRGGTTLGERILFWQENLGGPVLDPVGESERIERLRKEGVTINGDGVPVAEDAPRNLF